MKVSISVLLTAMFVGWAQADEDVAQTLSGAIRRMAVSTPSSAGSYVKDIRTTGDAKAMKVAASGLEDLLTKEWKLPSDVAIKFRTATFAKSVNFQTFQITIGKGLGALDEFVGAARNKGDDSPLEVGFVKVHAEGQTVPQYVSEEKCDSGHCCFPYIGFTCCCSYYTVRHSRGFTTAETNTIQQALRAAGYKYLNDVIVKQQKLTTLSLQAAFSGVPLLGAPNPASTTAAASGHPLLAKAMSETIKALKNVNQKHEDEIIRVLGDVRYNHWEESVSIQEIDGMVEGSFPVFKQYLRKSLDVPDNRAKEFELTLLLLEKTDKDNWLAFEVVVDPKHDGHCKYVCVLGRHDQTAHNYDFFISDMSATFDLAPDLYFHRVSSSSGLFGLNKESHVEIEERDHRISPDDVNVIFIFFQLLAFEQFFQLLDTADMLTHLSGSTSQSALTAEIVSFEEIPAVHPNVGAIANMVVIGCILLTMVGVAINQKMKRRLEYTPLK